MARAVLPESDVSPAVRALRALPEPVPAGREERTLGEAAWAVIAAGRGGTHPAP